MDYTANTSSSFSNNTVTGLTLTSKLYNLYTNSTIDKLISFTHYRDVTIISNIDTVFGTNNIYELSYNTISDLGSNFYSVHTSLDVYENSNHEKEIQSHTIPFISGSFTVDDSTYPDICGSFEWNGTLPSTFTNAVYDNSYVGIDLSGNSGDYKCIVYKVNTSDDEEYGNTTNYGVNLSYIANRLFGSTIETTLANDISNNVTDNTDILVYIVGYSTNAGKNVLGVINEGNGSTNLFEGGKAWYAQNTFENDNTPLSSLAGTSKVGARITEQQLKSTIISKILSVT